MSAQPADKDLHALFDEYHEAFLRENPEEATSLGRNEYNDRWRDWSPAARGRWLDAMRGFLQRLAAFRPDALNEQDRISLQLLHGMLERDIAGLPYEAWLTRVNQLFGLHTVVYLTIREMPARTPADYENILARLRAVPAYVEQNAAALREGLRAGVAQPALVVERILKQLEAQAAQPPEASGLLAAFRNFPETIGAADRRRLGGEAERLYAREFAPAWQKLRRFLAEEYLPQARADVAAATLPDGENAYKFFIARHTTTGLTAAQIHEMGKREVARIEKEMAAAAREAGFDGPLAEFEERLRSSPDHLFASKQEMLVYHRDIAMRVLPELPRLFPRLPRMPVGIRAIPADREAESASNYNSPAADGSRPGWFNLKTWRPETETKYDKAALVLHETNPGHHLQIALQLEMTDLPEFRKIYRATAYTEGWALYAESLGGELGVYDDPYSRFGALDSERFRARRLVVDTGIHAFGWSRERAIEYLGDVSEVERYIAWPGQALAYKIGQLKILELKAEARRRLGAEFDVREFHDAVLRNGALPLDLLEAQVKRYAASKR